MKKFTLSTLCFSLFCTYANAQEVATFEDLGLSVDQYWDGSDESAMFTSGGYTFINNYVDWGGYGSWDGFGYSTMTSTSYTQLSDQFNCCVGHGVNNSSTFGVGYYSAFMGTEPTIIANDASAFEATGCYITNAAYAYTSMKEGDDYTNKFDETDWFLLTATGYLEGEVTSTEEFYLAKDGKIVDDWSYFDLSSLGSVDEIHFTLSSSDNGQWGMNTPAYFCIDDFGAKNPVTSINNMQSTSIKKNIYDLQGRSRNQLKGLMIINGKVCIEK